MCSIILLFNIEGLGIDGDAVSHAVLPGIILAYLLGLPLLFGAFCAGVTCTLSIGYLKENSRIKEDTAMGIVFSGMFALGLVLFTKVKTDQHLSHILFGNLLGISALELIQTAIVSAIIFAIILLKRRDFLLYCFDPSHTRVAGLSPKLLHYGLLTLLALTIITAMQVVGVILVVAMLISPGIIAYILTKSFDKMLVIAICVSVFSSIFGVILSYHLDSAPGATIILLQASIFILVLIYSKFTISH